MMCAWFTTLDPITQALLAGIFTWTITATGAAVVFLTRQFNRRLLDAMLGFSGGVMIAASFWSLLAPALKLAEHDATLVWLKPTIGFLLGGIVLWGLDKAIPHLHLGFRLKEAEGPKTSFRRSVLLVTAITLHNIPEGLAIGVTFGGASPTYSTSLSAAMALTVGIGLQNFPEGIAVAMPLRGEGISRSKCFWYGQLSAIVEPIAAVIGCAAIAAAAPLLPYALSFAAGAMVYVVVEELIPESHRHGNVDLATVSFMIGFAVMMVLDVALG